jgi:hypothetical protein
MLLMSDENENIEGTNLSVPETKPVDLPKIGVNEGYKTSQGQLTILFTMFAMILSAFGYSNWTADKMQNTYDAIMVIGTTLAPLVGMVINLWNYTNSRGKTASNSIWATALLNTNSTEPLPEIRGLKIPWGKIGRVAGRIADPVLRSGVVPGGAIGASILENLTQKQIHTAGQPVENDIKQIREDLNQVIEYLKQRDGLE